MHSHITKWHTALDGRPTLGKDGRTAYPKEELWRTSNSVTKGPGLVCRPSKASTSTPASSWWSTSVCSSSMRLRAGSRVGYGGFTGRSWAGASAWEHTLLASSASVGAVLLVRNGRNARLGRWWTRREDHE